MMKRALSLLLCLIMVLGLAAPSVQATGDVYTSDNVMDNIVFDGDFSGNVVIDGNTVTSSGETQLTYPSDLQNNNTSVVEYVCKCANLATAVDHVGICQIKLPYMKQCEASEKEIFALWGSYTPEEQEFVLAYLEETYPLKHMEFLKLLSAPTGSASEILTDGTTVSVQGIPQNGSLNVGEAADEVKDIVDAYVAKREDSATELFGYDVSVLDGAGADWQPNTSVLMELELPGQKLHKYTKVYVVHVDDEGNATTIEAQVTEDGKIAFETPGFSAFYGFTVDFDYEGAQFSIPGGTSVKLSELFENLKMPLNAEDVVNVQYTDYTQITVEQLEGDWLLTSLKAFDTEEKLTLTMFDSTVYNIKVTDAITTQRASCYFTYRGYFTESYIAEEVDMAKNTGDHGNGVMTIKVNKNSGTYSTPTAAAGVSNLDYFWSQPLVFDGHDKNGAFEVVIEKADGGSGTYYLIIYEWFLRRGAIVNIRLDGFTSNDTLIIKQNHDEITSDSTLAMEPMFSIEDGSLYINVQDSSLFPKSSVSTFYASTSGAKLILDHANYTANGKDATIYAQCNSDNLYVNRATFRNSKYRAILAEPNEMPMFRLDNCVFENSVDYNGAVTSGSGDSAVVVGGGGAIFVADKIAGAWVNIRNMTLNNCVFGKAPTTTNTDVMNANGQGGAMAIYGFVDNAKFYGCDFNSCKPTQMAGAIVIGQKKHIGALTPNTQVIAYFGTITFEECDFLNLENGTSIGGAVLVCQNINALKFDHCNFTDTKAQSFGGAIHVGSTDNTPVPFNSITIEDCTFTRCKALGNYGGAIRICSNNVFNADVTMTGNTFSGCTALGTESSYTSGGAVAMDGTHFDDITISGTTFQNCQSTRYGGAVFIGSTNHNTGRTIVGDVSISDCTFTNNSAASMGGTIAFDCGTIASLTMENTSVDGSSGTFGGTVFVGSSLSSNPVSVGDVSITGCTFKNSVGKESGGTFYMTDGTYKSITFSNTTFDNCSSPRYGGGLYLRTHSKDLPFTVSEDISIIGCTFTNCHAGYLAVDTDEIVDGVPLTWDHDDNPDTPQIDRLNGVGGGGAITIGGTVLGKVEIKGASEAEPMRIENCTSWNNAGAILFPTATTDAAVPSYGAVEFQYLMVDKCFARDAGFAMYFAKVIIPTFTMDHCIIQNCGFFDLSNPNFPINNVFPASGNLDAKWFNKGTLDAAYVTKWQDKAKYPFDALCRSTDNGGTFRTIGNAHVVANITNCVFKNNKSYGGGAGVYWNALEIVNGLSPSLTLTNTLFDGNYSRGHGGGIYCESAIKINSCEFKNNVAGMSGGAIAQQVYNNVDRPLGVNESNKIELGTAAVPEGDVAVPTKIHHNQAQNGGGVAIAVAKTDSVVAGDLRHYPIEFTLGGAYVYENVATFNGGGIYYSTYTYDDPADQDEVDYFQKKIDLNDGLIWGNVAGATATQVTGTYTPNIGDQLIVAAVDNNMALGVDEDGNVGTETVITKHNTQDVIFDNTALVLTWMPGNQSGTYAFMNPDGTYLAANKNSGVKDDGTIVAGDHYQFGKVDFDNSTNAWVVSIASNGVATIKLKETMNDNTKRSIMRFLYVTNNTEAPDGWFNIYTPDLAYVETEKVDVMIYRVTSESNNHGTASLVTDINTLNYGDRFIFVALNPILGKHLTMKPSNYKTRRVSYLSYPTQNDVTYTEDTQVITLEDGATSGTIRMKVGNNLYLGGGNPSVTYSKDTQVITLENGATSGTFRLKVGNNSYLGGKSNNAELDAVDSKGINEWRLKIDSDANAVFDLNVTTDKTSNNESATDLRHILRLYVGAGSNAGKTWFNNYSTNNAPSHHAISVYRVASEENRKAIMVTKTGDLKAGDKIIIVAREVGYDVALGTQDGNTDGYLRKPTDITKFNGELDAVGSDGVNEWFLEIGPNGKALFDLNVATDKMINTVAATDLRHILRLYVGTGNSAGKTWFNNYSTSSAADHHDISVYRVTSEENRKATLVTRDSMLRAGDKFIIVAREEGYNVALSTQDGNTSGYLRKPTDITKYDNTMEFGGTMPVDKLTYSNLTYTEGTQIITLENGASTGTFALPVGDGQYLGMNTGAETSELVTVSTLDAESSWTITINPSTGEATIVGTGSGARNVMRYNTVGWFNTYTVNNNQKAICIYRVTSEEDRTATLVTKTSDLKAGGKIIIVAMDYNFALSTTQKGTTRLLAVVTKSLQQAKSSALQVLTVVPGNIDGTYGLQTLSGKYLAGGWDRLTLSDTMTNDSSWTLSVTDGILTAYSNGLNKFYLRYNAGTNAFGSYGNDTSHSNVVLYKFGTETSGGHGGAVYMNSNQFKTGSNTGYSELEISGCSMYGNVACVGNGGGIYLTGVNAKCLIYDNLDQGLETVVGYKVGETGKNGNKAYGIPTGNNQFVGGNGGGIAIFGNARIEMSGGHVSNNIASTAGGGIAVHNSTMSFSDGYVQHNTALYGGGISVMNGGDVDTVSGNSPVWGMEFSNGTISDNVASTIGGGICLSAQSTMKLSGGKVLNNYAATETVSGNKITYSYAEGQWGGGIAVSQGSYMDIYSGHVDENRAYNGAGIGISGNSKLEMMYQPGTTEGGSVSRNVATEKGGGIWLNAASAEAARNQIIITGGVIDGNSARDGGGISVGKYGYFELNDGAISKNTASGFGGGIYSKDDGGTYSQIYLYGGELSGNKATLDGGGFYGYHRVNLTVDGAKLINNESINNAGGAIYACWYGVVTITGGEISGNKAKTNGGGAVFYGAHYTSSISGGDIHHNEATNGAGLYLHGHNNYNVVKISGSPSIHSNIASGNGGGILADNAIIINMEGGNIHSNVAAGDGGGIYASTLANVTVMTGSVTDEKGNTIVTHGEISENTARNGGGVYVTSGANLTVNDGYIINNSAVAATKPNLTTAYGNDSKMAGVGGGICVTAGTSDVKSSFTLTGTVRADGRMDVAIYGNSATFAADDVFASGNNTKLTVPKVEQMNLAGYDFRPEAWTEDYVTDDSQYSIGTKMLSDEEIRTLGISRYRNASPDARKEMLISASAIDSIVNQNNKYVCMTLGIPGATKDTVLVDYDTKVDIDVSRNDLFINDTSYNEGKSYIGESFPEGALHKDGISCSTGTKPLANTVKDKDGKNVLDSYSKTFDGKKGVVTNNYNGVITFKANNTNIGTGYDFYYTVERDGFWYYAEVSVIPASSIYFDDSNSSIKYHKEGDSTLEHLATWSPVGSSMNATQSQIRPDTTLLGALDADKIYGYDSSFVSTEDYSNGSGYHVTVERHYGVDNDNDGKCDALCGTNECGEAIQLTHDFGGKGTKCNICLNTKDKHGDDVPEHTCREYTTYNEYCDYCAKWIGTHTTNARATFTFTGTGFDIVSLCNANTGVVMITVFKGVVENWDDPNWDNYVASYMVNTYYGYDYDSGKWVPDQNSTTSLYQVPVIQTDLSKVMMIADDPETDEDEAVYKDFGYGTYSVEIYVAPSFLEREQGYWGTEFYLDGIRIYNPAGDGTGIYVTDEPVLDEDGYIVYDEFYQPVYKEILIDNAEIMDIYKNDGEGWPIYQELRNLIISHDDSLKDESGNGVIFIDGIGTPTMEDYIGYGPNNEVYLLAGKSIAFRLDALNYTNKLEEATNQDFDGSVVQSIHLGVRGLTGQSAVTITDSNGNTISQALGTTDMYYDISGMANKVVTIRNTGSEPIAISNIKITHSVNPYGVEGTGSGTWSGRDLVTINPSDAQIALDILTPDKLVDPVLKPKYPALSFEGMVSYNVFFSAEQLGGLTAADLGLAVFDSYDPEGTVETAKDVILGAEQIDGLYMVATNGVHAKYLGDTQYFRAFVKQADGSYVYSKMVSYSALDYAKNALAKSNDVKLKQLVVAMLNYGAEAQKFFGYNTENLMNKDLTADQQALVTGYDSSLLDAVVKADPAKIGVFGSTGGFAKKYPAISFKGAFEINYFMAPSNTVDSDMTLYCWSEDTYNSFVELTAENADKVVTMTLENGLYTASSFEIAAKDLDKTVYVAAVYESNGQTYCSGVLPYSIAAYCQKPSADVAALANAAAVYGCAAKEFFGA